MNENVAKWVRELIYVGVIHSKKNRHIPVMQGGRMRVIPDAVAREQEMDMIQQFKSQLGRASTATKAQQLVQANKMGVKYHIVFRIWQVNSIRRDLDNQVSSLLDALVRSGAIVDDCRKFVRSFTVVDEGIDRQRPRAEIRIFIMEDAREG